MSKNTAILALLVVIALISVSVTFYNTVIMKNFVTFSGEVTE
ncbi:MAG: hypothetical protein Q8P01_03485 [bacterium]|nr:hypothetical protein [bacterium]